MEKNQLLSHYCRLAAKHCAKLSGKSFKKELMKKLVLLFFAPLLMATQCEDDTTETVFRNNFKVKITNQTDLNINDTIWIEGRVSSKVYDSKIGDSTFADYPDPLDISLFKFTTPTPNYNAKDAIDKFDVIHPNGLVDFLGMCTNSSMRITPTLNSDGSLYKFKIGLKAKDSGDFIIKFPYKQKIENTERHLFLITAYPSPNHNYLIGFNRCGYTTWELESDTGDYCFKVN